jgi:hypothetical protein
MHPPFNKGFPTRPRAQQGVRVQGLGDFNFTNQNKQTSFLNRWIANTLQKLGFWVTQKTNFFSPITKTIYDIRYCNRE